MAQLLRACTILPEYWSWLLSTFAGKTQNCLLLQFQGHLIPLASVELTCTCMHACTHTQNIIKNNKSRSLKTKYIHIVDKYIFMSPLWIT